ncbi:MAG: TRAP transporter small permease subunit, partial [Alphaproteobacteria bacterium]
MLDRLISRLTRALNITAALWLLVLALLILFDVAGRGLFNKPFLGTFEIVKNSVVAILFLQLPYTLFKGRMLRTTLVYEQVGPGGRRLIDALSYAIGTALFLAIGIGGWPDMITAWRVLEFEGVGAFEFPTYPTRTIIVLLAFLAAAVCFLHILKLFHGG